MSVVLNINPKDKEAPETFDLIQIQLLNLIISSTTLFQSVV